MFSLEHKSSIKDSSINRLLGIRKARMQNLQTEETNFNNIFEGAIISTVKSIWKGVLVESQVIDTFDHAESLDQIFEAVFETTCKYTSKELRENANQLPRFFRGVVMLAETSAAVAAENGSIQLTDEESSAIDDIMQVSGKPDAVEELSKRINTSIELSGSIGEKITDYEEKEIEAKLEKASPDDNQLESAVALMSGKSRYARNIIESIAISNYKSLLSESATSINDVDISKIKTTTMITYSLLETMNYLGIINNDPKSVRELSLNIRG